MIYSDLLGHIKTVDQSREFDTEIDVLLNSLFNSQSGFEDGLKTISASHSELLKNAFLINKVNTDSQNAIKEYLKGLKFEIQKLKKLRLTLAFEPNEPTIDNLFSWVAQNLGDGLILEIKVDNTILGGTIIEFEGKYLDLSLNKRLEEMFRDKKEKIISSINIKN